MEWFRAYHGICSDAKWPIVARKAKVSVGVVVSVWLVLLESASQADERGSVVDFDSETVDALYGYEDGTTEAVFDALREKGLICDGRIHNWDKRQPKRERDDDSAARVRRHRELKRRETTDSANMDERNASVTPGNASVTPPDKRREEKRILNTPPLPPASGGESEGEDEGTFPAPAPGKRGEGTNPRRVRQPTAYSADFEAFWQLYPRKVGKDAAWRVWMRKKHELPLANELAAILARQCHCEQWQRDGGQYIPHPATWLNQGRWQDEIETAGAAMAYPEGW